MISANAGPIVLPALRGIMGSRAYYSCLMTFEQLAIRVNFAKQIHSHKSFSDMIQRELEDKRSTEIATYLKDNPDRFFNSLVVAAYDGDPNWHPLSDVKSRYNEQTLLHLSDETIASVGFLTLRGDEQLFALDGQHRLAGIKRALDDGMPKSDEVSVIFLGHKNSANGIRATRRLFTTLNKTAQSVSKDFIIALDEDDVMAICVRQLIEESRLFEGNSVAFVGSSNMPPKNTDSLTTIGNLYDVLRILFSNVRADIRMDKSRLRRERPPDEELAKYVALATTFFEVSEMYIDELREFFSSDDRRCVVAKYRGKHGGSMLFRPVGLEIFAHVVARLTEDTSLKDAVKRASTLPRTLSEAPYRGLMWDKTTGTVSSAHRVLIRELLLYMLGSRTKWSREALRASYREKMGIEDAELPVPIGGGEVLDGENVGS